MRYYIIAGEASGDLHGSNLILGLKNQDPQAQIRFWGGDLMAAQAGTSPVVHYKDGAVMGISDVINKLGKIGGNLKLCKQDILNWQPDVVILIDYPGFNLQIAKFAHGKGFKVFYYIAPKTWASRESRNRKIKQWVDRLFIVFPFETEYFTKQNIPFSYCGNPLLDSIDSHEFKRPVEGSYIALLAGSRKGEIKRMMPVCMEVADRLGKQIVIAGAPSRSEQDYLEFIGSRSNVQLIFNRTYDILKYADSAIINSGTASLEAALIGTPQVVCWSSSRLTVFIARKVLKVMDHIKYISLGNLCIDRFAFKELVQEDFTVENVCAELTEINSNISYREKMLSDYADIRESLGGSGASVAVAKQMIQTLRQK